MERFDFHPQKRVFVAGSNRVYIGALPMHLANKELPEDVARVALFRLAERDGCALVFKGGDFYATSYPGKVLKSQNTGVETCFVIYKGARIQLEATNYMMGGRRLSKSRQGKQ